MHLVIADSGPPHYLVLIGAVDSLERLFGTLLIPDIVRDELAHPSAPRVVREWITQPPVWVEIAKSPSGHDAELQKLDPGERAAIALATARHADLLLMDDRQGVALARHKGFAVIGTLGILDLAARRGLLNLGEAFARLEKTNFRYPPKVMKALLEQHVPKPQA